MQVLYYACIIFYHVYTIFVSFLSLHKLFLVSKFFCAPLEKQRVFNDAIAKKIGVFTLHGWDICVFYFYFILCVFYF